jgi:osmotically-inducible protein OsmY
MHKTTSLAIAIAALLALAGCDSKPDGQTPGQKLDQAIASAKTASAEATENAKRGLDRAADVTKEKSAEMAQKTGVLAEKAGRQLERAGQKAGEETEGLGRKMSDATITAAVKAGLAKDPDLSALRIDVDTHEGRVSLTGSAPSESAKQRAQAIAQGAKGVTGVDNRLTVAKG